MASAYSLDELLAYPGRSTRALVDLDAIRDNARSLRAHVGESIELMAVVKADGYGHGAVTVAREAINGGATWLGVATVAEGRELRDAGLQAAVLVLGPIHASEIDAAIAERLDVTVGDEPLAEAMSGRAEAGLPLPRLHLKVDTGMHRYGVAPERALAVLDRLTSASPSSVLALCTHLASADAPDGKLSERQDRVLRDVLREARRGHPDLAVHVANSSASMSGWADGTTIARTGIALYGCSVPLDRAAAMGLRPAMSIVSRLMRVHDLAAGDGVSYGHTYVADAEERVGLVPIGYADGYVRSLSGLGWMSVRGVEAPVRGRVCMDQTVIGDLPRSAGHGDWVGIVGPALGGPAWDDLATMGDTIDYELLTSAGRRVARLYHRSGLLVAVRDEMGRYVEIADIENAPCRHVAAGGVLVVRRR